ncbi:hypothetical protein K7640_24785 [Micromonospora sp. PLK6-60]|uniref:hypothetical protein n=1 Tax=Micromonospora sp. PLK6-60 TaxID=2873383 RepID=UPI001CA66489|nr:hypothetical protein [Micromonospora sp. PLK6-60]MBY8875049.1 hypothetical protein [Micromonospora sp. PLK6-60]
MNPDLRELIVEVRAELAADQPATLVWAQIEQAAPADKIPAEVPQPVRELLEVADGVRAGDFELWGTADVDYRRDMLGNMPEFTGVADEPAEWYYLGDLAREPLLLRRDTGAVWWFPRTSDDPFYVRGEFEELMPTLEYLLAAYVFGPLYADVAAQDEWWEFLDEHGLTTVDEDDEESGE